MPLQSTQDLDARFSVFLNPIRDLTKNWEVDIAKYLEDYLVELSEIQITFDGGVTVMNFAEAAMLIQGSATVYSKKVEFLWQMVLQMLDLLSSKRTLDINASENHQKQGVGKGSKESLTLEFQKVDGVSSGKNIDMKEDQEEEERKEDFKFLPQIPLHLVEKEGEKSALRITLYLKNFETFGNKDDFRLNRSYLTPSGLLCLDLPHEILRQNNQRFGQSEREANDSIAGFIETSNVDNDLFTPLTENLPDNDPEDGIDHGGGIEDYQMDVSLSSEPPSSPPKEVETPPEVPDKEEVPEIVTSDIRSQSLETLNERHGLRQRKVKEKVAQVKMTNPMKPIDPHIETPAKRPIRAGRIRKPVACNCHCEVLKKTSRTRSKVLKEASGQTKSRSVDSFILGGVIALNNNNSISNNNNTVNTKNGTSIDPKIAEKYAKEEKKSQALSKAVKVREVLEKDGKLISDAEAEEKIEEDERIKNRIEDGENFGNDDAPDLDFDSIDAGGEFLLPNPHEEIYTPFGTIGQDVDQAPKSLNDSLLYEPGSEYEALVQKWVSEYIASAQEHISSSELTRRVNKWRKNITPKLAEEEERKTFDIHQYGSFVLSHFSSENEKSLFEDVAKSSDSREVARIFLSCLMLANTYNLELSETREGDLEMDCLELKLLSKVRHHKELEEYAAPSQTTRAENVNSGKTKRGKRKKVETSSEEEEEISDSSNTEEEEWEEDAEVKNRKNSKHTKKRKPVTRQV